MGTTKVYDSAELHSTFTAGGGIAGLVSQLRDSMTLSEAQRRIALVRRVDVYVGIRSEQGAELVTYAAANEFGVPGRIPERSFLRSTADENRRRYTTELMDAAVAVLDGQDVGSAFGRVGLGAVGDVQVKIRQLRIPPNAPSTIRRKGSSNPLIDTGRMRQSIEYEVRAGGSVVVVG